ncbi:MAG: SapC family protein [Alphaproteobacteria bacterium]
MGRSVAATAGRSKAATGARPATKAGGAKAKGAAKRAAPKAPQKVSEPHYLFYNSVEKLDPKQHGRLGLSASASYGFARPTNSIPLNVVEFSAAARHYPIIFHSDAEGMPLAVVGLRSRENLFVEKDGSWAEGCYVPAFVRRYPFLLLTRSGTNEIAFCVDASAEMLKQRGSRPLFSDNKPTDLMQNVARFCGAYAREQNRTRQFVQALREHGLLMDRSADIRLPDGEKIALRGFRVINEARLRELPDKLLAEWCRNGFMTWIGSHIVSMGNFGRLYHRAK